ncbi:hypothetical protein L7F22_041477 [Adiantum nelumboides]|nr:hypothetical protein [Adiantum nelumboides]
MANSSSPFSHFTCKPCQQQDLSALSWLPPSSCFSSHTFKGIRRRAGPRAIQNFPSLSPFERPATRQLPNFGSVQHLRVTETSGATLSSHCSQDIHVLCHGTAVGKRTTLHLRDWRAFASASSGIGVGGGFRGDGTATFGSSMGWDEGDEDDVYFNAASTIQGVDVEYRRRSIWQPIELERLESCAENDLRFLFLENLMVKAREGDPEGAEETFADMVAVGLNPGPRCFHGLVVSYSRSGDAEGAILLLLAQMACQDPLATCSTGLSSHCDVRIIGNSAQLIASSFGQVYVDECKLSVETLKSLNKNHDSEEAQIFRELYMELEEIDRRVSCTQSCKKVIVRGSAFRDDKKPDTESYNWLFQSQVRCQVGGDRIQQLVDLVGIMVEDYKKVQPNTTTYLILTEGFTKYNVVDEALRHFRALSKFPKGMQLLHNNGENGDPLSLYLRLVCLHGKIDDLIEVLEVMERDNQPIPKRAMIGNRKGRTLVSSWIEPLQQEAELGYEIDYIAKYIAEGGLTGTRQRWSPSLSGDYFPVNPDSEGFRYAAPVEISFKKHCAEARAIYACELIKKLQRDGVSALGPGATEEDVSMIMTKLRKDMLAESIAQVRKPKAASKMLVSELKEELEAQGLPSDGTRPVLYQRVQKSRRINRARNRPLWLPPEVEVTEQVDDRVEMFLSRLNLKNEYSTEYWRKRFLGESTEDEGEDSGNGEIAETVSNGEASEGKSDDGDGEDEVEEETVDVEDGGEEEEVEPQVMLATQLMENEETLETRRDDSLFEFNLEENQET